MGSWSFIQTQDWVCGRLFKQLGLQSPLWGCAGDRVAMVVKCIVGLFWGTHFQHGGKFVPQNSPTMHHLDPISRPISKWRMNGDGTELDESFTRRDHTHRTSYRSGWPGGFGTLILIFTSEYLLPSLFAFRHRFYSFTPATVQSYPHFDSDVNQ